VILTKNPEMLCEEPYLSTIRSQQIKTLTVQVSCAFWRDEARSFYEPKAPSVGKRLDAIKSLAREGVDVELRIDPLFPSARISRELRIHNDLTDYGIPEAQTQDDIEQLVCFAKEIGAKAVIAKPLKVPISNNAQRCKDWFVELYRHAWPSGRRTVSGGSWRLPPIYQEALVSSVQDICLKAGIEFRHCKHDVATRK